MSRRSWVTSSLARRPEIFCCVFSGRTPLSLMLFVGHTMRPGCPAASPASSSPPAPRHAAAAGAASAPAGHPSSAASRSSRCSATPPAQPRPAAPAGQRPPPPAPRSAPPAPEISASRGSSGGTSVTAPDHPRNHAQPSRQYHARRQNVTAHHAPQQQAQGPECLRPNTPGLRSSWGLLHAGRDETGLPTRQDVLELGFHAVPAGAARWLGPSPSDGPR
jgi:hypothetical protein